MIKTRDVSLLIEKSKQGHAVYFRRKPHLKVKVFWEAGIGDMMATFFEHHPDTAEGIDRSIKAGYTFYYEEEPNVQSVS